VFRDPLPVFYTRDVARALAFYCDALGFEPGYRFPDDGDPEFAVVRLGESALALSAAETPQELLGVSMGREPRFELCLFCDDVDAEAARLAAAGVEILREPDNMPWGERVAYVADPDGNPIQLAQPLGHER
jgi:lactoylglutathione lyase